MSMNIIFSNYDDLSNPYYAGGGAIAIHEVARRLVVNFGHHVIVVTGKYPGSQNSVIDGVTYRRVGVNLGGPLIGQLLYQIYLPLHLLFSKKEFDVWVESFTPPFSTACLPLFTKKPVIGLTHLLGGEGMKRKYKIPFDIFEKWGLKTYHWIITLNEELRQKILSANKNISIAIIPNGLPKEIINLKIKKRDDYILFLGRIDVFQKGLDILLRSFKSIQDSTSYDLVIAGSGIISEENHLKMMVEKLGLEGRVKLIGKVSGSKKNEVLGNAAIMVMPSRGENFPLVILEAFAAELPVVAFNISGARWAPEKFVLRAPAFDEKAYGALILKLLNDVSLRREVGSKAKEYVKEYDWDVITAKYNQFILSIVHK